jgi:cardiolipin synthase
MAVVQNPQEFAEDFISHARHAKSHIYLQSMHFEAGKILDRMAPVFIEKVKEGVEVHLTIDWVHRRFVGEDANLLPALSPKKRAFNKEVQQRNTEFISKLTKAGVLFTITNHPNLVSTFLSIFDRNHIKLYIIDDTAAWVGGVNLFDEAFEMIDFMVKFSDRHIIQILKEQFFKVNERKPSTNYLKRCDSYNDFLVDNGTWNSSLIYDTAVDMVQEAQHSILFVSQFVPDGKMLSLLLEKSKAGIKVEVLTSEESGKQFVALPYNLTYLTYKRKTRNSTIDLQHLHKRVHAKLLVIDGKTALFGSHNLVEIGVKLGTEEIAMKTVDLALVSDLNKFIRSFK